VYHISRRNLGSLGRVRNSVAGPQLTSRRRWSNHGWTGTRTLTRRNHPARLLNQLPLQLDRAPSSFSHFHLSHTFGRIPAVYSSFPVQIPFHRIMTRPTSFEAYIPHTSFSILDPSLLSPIHLVVFCRVSVPSPVPRCSDRLETRTPSCLSLAYLWAEPVR